jgi:polyhydroxyalkanoate synthesis regulator phasin
MSRFFLLKGLGARAGATGARLGKKALDSLLNDPQRADAFELAARGVQGGRRMLDEQIERLIGAMGLATQTDLERVHRKLSALRRRLEALADEAVAAAEQAEAQDRAAAAAGSADRPKP